MNRWPNKSKYIAFGILFTATVVYSLMEWFTPLMLDDYVFKAVYLRFNNLHTDFNPAAFSSYFHELRECDNQRLSNLLSPFSTTISPWKDIFPVATGIAIAMIIGLCAGFIASPCYDNQSNVCSRTRLLSKYPLCIAIVWLAIIVLLPWRNNLFVADYALNYVYGAALMLSFIAIALYALLQSADGKKNRMAVIALCLLAIPSGMWHEGFSVPTLLGFLAITLRNPKEKRWWWWSAGILMALGILIAGMAPGTLSRADNQIDGSIHLSPMLLVDYAGVCVLISLMLILALFPNGRQILHTCFKSNIFLLFICAAIPGASLSIIAPHSPRMAFYPDICAIICAGIICRNFLSFSKKRRKIFKRIYSPVGIISCLLILFQSATVLAWQFALHKEEEEIMMLLSESSTGTVFYNYFSTDDIPVYSLYFPAKGEWIEPYNYRALNEYLSTTQRKPIPSAYPAVVPLELFSAQKGTYSSGLVTDSLFTSEACLINISGTLKYESGEVRDVADYPCLALPFTNSFGKKLIFIHPLGKGSPTFLSTL